MWWRKDTKVRGLKYSAPNIKLCINDIHSLFAEKWGGTNPPCPPISPPLIYENHNSTTKPRLNRKSLFGFSLRYMETALRQLHANFSSL